jgi:PAS domain S-box-containing protein
LSVLAVGAAFAMRLALDPLWGDRLPYGTFFLANLAVMQLAGIRPFVLATCAGFVLSDWFFVAPRQSFLISDRVNHINAVFYFLVSFAMLYFSQRARRSLEKEQAARESLQQSLEELRESEARYSAVVQNSMDAILLTGSEGQILAANVAACRIFGRTEEDLQRIGQLALADPADRQRIGQSIAGENKANVQLEVTLLRSDGTKFTGEISSAVFTDSEGLPKRSSIIRDITDRKRAEAHLELLHKELVTASHQAGMAEIASNVLHNVGNVLNTVNVSATVVQNAVNRSKTSSLTKVLSLLRENENNLASFLGTDPRGKQLIPFLASTLEHLEKERSKVMQELDVLRKSVDHIKQIVAQQQSYARMGGVLEKSRIVDIVEDALRIYPASADTQSMEMVREYGELPPTLINRHQLLQILVNMLQNARRACEEIHNGKITVRVRPADPKRFTIEVADNGVGIAPENLTRIFGHGFTTRKNGHGFGLHSGALAAKDMGGSLAAHSDGLGKGATFVLELPLTSANTGQNPSANPALNGEKGC